MILTPSQTRGVALSMNPHVVNYCKGQFLRGDPLVQRYQYHLRSPRAGLNNKRPPKYFKYASLSLRTIGLFIFMCANLQKKCSTAHLVSQLNFTRLAQSPLEASRPLFQLFFESVYMTRSRYSLYY